MLLRIPGVGPKSARRIVYARKNGRVDFEHLKRMGVVLKRAHYFITCQGRMLYPVKLEEKSIFRQMADLDHKDNWQIGQQQSFYQMSLFDDFGISGSENEGER